MINKFIIRYALKKIVKIWKQSDVEDPFVLSAKEDYGISYVTQGNDTLHIVVEL